MANENWSSKFGVILAVSGSAVGLGNFLKFPGQVAEHGGAAFMIAYVLSFIFIGLPISIVEWTLGRQGGVNEFHSSAGILGYFCKTKKMAYIGLLGALLTLIVFCYYIYIESWCLGYAYAFFMGLLEFSTLSESKEFFSNFIGAAENGSALGFGLDKVLVFLIFCFALNFWLIYRGVSKGIEFFCKYAMPLLIILAIVIVIRIMTLSDISPEHPERSINQGLGFMWNPTKVVLESKTETGNWQNIQRLVGDIEISKAKQEVAANPESLRIKEIPLWVQLLNPSIWVAAAGQVFFSLTVGFGSVMTYASYLRKRDDIVLSSVTSCSANEFCEVCLGGLITVPAAVAFFGVSGAMSAGLSLFDLGFKVLPLFFVSLPLGQFFGFLFFFLLFLAAVTSSLSMLQPSLAFLEEALRLRRNFSTLLLGLISTFIVGFVVYFSKDLKAMSTFDFWMGQVAIYFFATTQVIIFAWYFGAKKGMHLANEGSEIKLPLLFVPIIKYLTPTFLVLVFLLWAAQDVFGFIGDGTLSPYITDLIGGKDGVNSVAWMAIFILCALYFFFAAILKMSRRYNNLDKKGAK